MVSKSLEETSVVAQNILDLARSKAGEGAFLITLSGDLGSGKTALTQAIAKHLGIVESITSPTFVIEKRYTTSDPVFTKLVHIDAYRLEGSKELLSLDFEETLKAPNTLIVLEWPEKVPECIPPQALKVKLAWVSDSERLIEIINV